MMPKSYTVLLRKVLIMQVMIFSIGIATASKEEGSGNKTEILFLGSSYFNFNNMPGMFSCLADSAGKEVYVSCYMPSGLYLYDHAKSSKTAAKIKERKWDFVVLQGVGSTMAYPDYYTENPVYSSLIILKNLIAENCSTTRIIFTMPWAFEDGMTWLGWPDTYEDMQLKIYDRTLSYSSRFGYTTAPVGWVWYHVLEYEGYPLHYLHLSDWNHPSVKGSYIMACVLYSTIFIENTIGNTFLCNLPESEAAYFQDISSSTVLNDKLLWKIRTYTDRTVSEDTTTTVSSALNGNIGFSLQNNPNPFISTTNISFQLNHDSFVELRVVDVNGRICSTLLCEYKTPGKYQIPFSADNLQSGTYIYKLSTNNNCQYKKMLITH